MCYTKVHLWLSITSPFLTNLLFSWSLKLSIFSNLFKAWCVHCLQMIQYWVLLKKTSFESLEQLCIAINPLYKKPSKQEACPLVRSKSIESIFIYTFMVYFNSSVPRQSLINSFNSPCGFFGRFHLLLSPLFGMKEVGDRNREWKKPAALINEMLRQLTEQWIRAPLPVWIWWDTELSHGKIHIYHCVLNSPLNIKWLQKQQVKWTCASSCSLFWCKHNEV